MERGNWNKNYRYNERMNRLPEAHEEHKGEKASTLPASKQKTKEKDNVEQLMEAHQKDLESSRLTDEILENFQKMRTNT